MAERVRGGRKDPPLPEPKPLVPTTNIDAVLATIDDVLTDYEKEKKHVD